MVDKGEMSIEIESLAQLCVEYWKLMVVMEKALAKVQEKDGKRLEAQLKFSKRQLDVILQDLGLRLVDVSGERFHPGLAVSVDNPAQHEDEEVLMISQTLEPTVMSGMTILRRGRVIVAPVQNEEE